MRMELESGKITGRNTCMPFREIGKSRNVCLLCLRQGPLLYGNGHSDSLIGAQSQGSRKRVQAVRLMLSCPSDKQSLFRLVNIRARDGVPDALVVLEVIVVAEVHVCR